MSRVELSKIPSLTFYKDEKTAARRTSALPQLTCIGRPCKLYQPDVIRCVNAGGQGVDIDWKCEADLPEALRFGKVEVNCEGWSKPGDPYVLKGSCALEYRLVQVPDSLRNGKADNPIFPSTGGYEVSTIVFWVLWLFVLGIMVISFVTSCLGGDDDRTRTYRGNDNRPRPDGGGGWGRGWFPGDNRDDYNAPPPPYSKDGGWGAWRPGFWTGAAVGGLANQIWNRNRDQRPEPEPARPNTWGWERRWPPFSSESQPTYRRARPAFDDDNRGEGSSSLGAMRSSTGIGGSKVR